MQRTPVVSSVYILAFHIVGGFLFIFIKCQVKHGMVKKKPDSWTMQSHNTRDSITLQYKHISKHKLGFKVFYGIILYFKQSKIVVAMTNQYKT